MHIWRSIKQKCENASIKLKFAVGAGLLAFLMAIVAGIGLLSLMYVQNADHSITQITEIRRLILELDRGMERARRLHSAFFLYYPTLDLQKAHVKYAQPSIRQVAKVVSISESLKSMIHHLPATSPFRHHHVDLNLYLSSANRFAATSIQSFELVTQLAAPVNGLEGRVDTLFKQMERQLIGKKRLMGILHDIQALVLQHRLTRKRYLFQSALNRAFQLHQMLVSSQELNKKEKQSLYSFLDEWEDLSKEIQEIYTQIDGKFSDFALQEDNVKGVSTSLIHLADAEVARAQTRISSVHRLTQLTLFCVTLLGLISWAIISWILNVSVTRRVVNLTRSAKALKKGNLTISAKETPFDELGELGRTFNFMAARIKKLIEGLEEQVEQRTAALVESERRFRELFEHSTSGVAVYEAVDNGDDFIFKDINRAVEQIEMMKREEILGRKVTKVFPGIIDFGLLDVLRDVWNSGTPRQHPTKRYTDGELTFWRKNLVYKLPSGEIVAVYDDVTAQKEAEIQKDLIQKQLEQSKKMEAIGLLAGGVAHDLNNILSGIVGYPELLLMDIPEESPLRKPILAIHDSGLRATAVVADLLTVARGVANTKSTADLNRLVEAHLNSPEMQTRLREKASLAYRTEFEASVSTISCSPIHIQKCIMNLVTNALEAMEGNGELTLSTSNRTINDEFALKNGIKPGVYVVLDVKDTGSGISEEDLNHIFEPFYTKKVMGRSGTGLGLAVVWNTMQDHNGTALVESGPTGTTVSLYFPATFPDSAQHGRENEDKKIDWSGHGETVLIIDDEPQLRNLSKSVLKAHNYNAVTVSSGEEAIEYVKENRADILLLDMFMDPGINGRETYERIIKIHPGQRALIVSGFSESDDVTQTLALGAGGFLKKPYKVKVLVKAIKQVLSGGTV